MSDQWIVAIVGVLAFLSFMSGWLFGVSEVRNATTYTDTEHGKEPL